MRVLFIVNPIAGGGRAEKAARFLQTELKSVRGVESDFKRTREAGHAESMALDGVRHGCTRVVAVGGDGTLHEVVNGILAASSLEARPDPLPSIGLIPCGTGNDFARGMGLYSTAHSALQTVLDEGDINIDVGLINDRAFVNVAGFGFDAKVAKLVTERYQGKRSALPYLVTALRTLKSYAPTMLHIEVDGVAREARALLGAVGNASTYGGGMKICPKAVAHDGQLDLCLVEDVTKLETVVNLARVFRGSHLSHPKCSYTQATRISVSADEDVLVHADGQMLGTLPVTFSILPGALRLAAKRK